MLAAMKRTQTATMLSGAERSAILVMYLSPDVAKQVLTHFDTAELDAIGRAMASVASVEPDVIENVISDFVNDLNGASLVPRTGPDYVLEVLPDLLPENKREEVQRRLKRVVSTKFQDTIEATPANVLYAILRTEHVQTQALGLLLMGANSAARVLAEYPDDQRHELTLRMSGIEKVPTELAEDIEGDILSALEADRTEQWPVPGLERTAKILGSLGADAQEDVLERIAESQPSLSDDLRRRLVVFEDLLRIDDRGLQRLLREIDKNHLKIALRGAERELVEHFMNNLSSRAAADLDDELKTGERIPKAEIDAARAAIIDAAMEQRHQGNLVLPIGADAELV